MARGNYIGGSWQAASGASFASLNPATQEPVWQGNAASAADVDAAVEAARAAFESWRRLSVAQRMTVIEKFKTLLQAASAGFAETIARETGKVLWDARSEVQAMVNKADISLRAFQERTPDIRKGPGHLQHRPHGVMAVFGPYNFPGHLPNGHIMPALIAGNTVVFKPSDHTPLVAEETAALWHEAGLPAGVLNLVPGGRETGEALAAHDGIDGLLFTGSVEVGTLLHRQFAGKPEKMLALELGGNNPLIVWDSANAEAAAVLIIQSAFLTSGQRCTCARRLIVPQGQAGDAILAAAVALARRIRVGTYTDSPEPFMGPLIANREADKVVEGWNALKQAGGVDLLALGRPNGELPFLTPGIIDVTHVQNRPDRELFGPLLQVIRVPDFGSALREANNTRLGLAAALISDSVEHFARFSAEIRAGVVNWNRPTNGASSEMPFGGIGLSGNHRPSAYYAADYCAWPMATMESPALAMPDLPAGIEQ